MPYKDYKILNELRSGGTSHVYKVLDNDTEEIRVMKVTSFNQIQKLVWLNEIQMLQKFQYIRGVVKLYEFGEVEDSNHENFGYAVLEVCEDDLFESPIREPERKSIFLFLYSILTTIHALGYCYCDLKPENILRKGKGFRLCDFSSCQPIGTLTNVMYGTPHVMAPEIVQTLESKKDYFYDEKIDSWGLGCLLYELITNEQFDRNDWQLQNVSDPYYRTILQLCLEANPLTRVRVWELSKKMKDLDKYAPTFPGYDAVMETSSQISSQHNPLLSLNLSSAAHSTSVGGVVTNGDQHQQTHPQQSPYPQQTQQTQQSPHPQQSPPPVSLPPTLRPPNGPALLRHVRTDLLKRMRHQTHVPQRPSHDYPDLTSHRKISSDPYQAHPVLADGPPGLSAKALRMKRGLWVGGRVVRHGRANPN